jgi:GNAT superfamily N-acetyltransferase
LVGHCDIGLPDDYSPFNLTFHPSSPTTTVEDNANTLEIYSLYIHPSMHHTGCSQRLFTSAAREGLRKFARVQRMIVMTFEVNQPATKFYEKMGGRLYKILSGFPEDGKFWNIIFFEWLDLPTWVHKWEQMYNL